MGVSRIGYNGLADGCVKTKESDMSRHPIQSPYLAIANKAHEQMAHMLAEFGMTPSSRAHCTVMKPDDPSPYAKFVKKT
ncbi:P27 family phage terminase small subunit [Paraburkholderia sp. SIMBA_030]|uniref:P27 family phage terminase small subunit n=1 Tax=Paraburkholderia sp. SIMBA_030 TaxID=3085773 RepID=UPI00397A8E95